MIPTVGRMVHYTGHGNRNSVAMETLAAIITSVKLHNQFYENQPPADSEENKYRVSLHVFYPTGQIDFLEVPWSEQPRLEHWSWPPKV